RLALARAFLADRPLLLLDEPTANLDAETEADIVESVRHLAHDRTVVLIVHRPALLAVADRVIRVAGPGASAVRAAREVPAGRAVASAGEVGRAANAGRAALAGQAGQAEAGQAGLAALT